MPRPWSQNVRDRGRRIEEQIEVLRLLWSMQPSVTFDGRYHKLDKVGLNRVADRCRASRCGSVRAIGRRQRCVVWQSRPDGWMSLGDPTPDLPRPSGTYMRRGADPGALKVRAPLPAGEGGEAAWIAAGTRLKAAGVTHLNIIAPLDLAPAQALPRIVEARRVLAEALG